MFKKIDHIRIAVEDLDRASALFCGLLKSEPVSQEFVPDQRVSVVSFMVGGTSIELVEATDSDSPIAKFVKRHGEGIHHIAFEVDDIRAELERLLGEGFRLIDQTPKIGAYDCLVAFVHPKSALGVLIELTQKSPGR
jgi:methylmalonyl-CoA/ethylmalonyl-CoA epimerase